MLNDEKLLQRGMQTMNDIDGEQGAKVMQALADIAPDLGRYIIGFGFGEIYNRPHLDNQRRELITLAALAAQGGCQAGGGGHRFPGRRLQHERRMAAPAGQGGREAVDGAESRGRHRRVRGGAAAPRQQPRAP